MKLSPVIFLSQEKTTHINILTDDIIIQNGVPKSKKIFWHIWRTIAPQHLTFMNNEGQSYESTFFLLSESENRIEKSCLYQELRLLLLCLSTSLTI